MPLTIMPQEPQIAIRQDQRKLRGGVQLILMYCRASSRDISLR